VKSALLCALTVTFLANLDAQSTTRYTISTVAGNGSPDQPPGDGGLATAAALVPRGVAVDGAGDIFIIDSGSVTASRPSTVRAVVAGVINTLACDGPDGLGTPPWGPILPVHQALCGDLSGVAVDLLENVYIAQGGGRTVDVVPFGQGIVAIDNFDVNGPQNLAIDNQGRVLVADSGNCRIVAIDSTGALSLVAGGTCGFSGDNGLAIDAALSFVTGVAADANGNVYIADINNARVRKVDSTSGIITTVAGNGCITYGAGDGGPAVDASLCYPAAVTVDGSGNLFIAESSAGLIRRVDTTGTITTIAGGVGNTTLGDGGPATSAKLEFPFDLVVGPGGLIYVSDAGNFRVRVLTPVSPTLITNVAVTSTGLLFSRVTRTFHTTFTITNTGTQTISGPIQLVLSKLPGGVTLVNASGMTNGSPFLTIPGVANLAPGQSASVGAFFRDPSNAPITATPLVYSGSF
jgi:hypothetical protein